MAMPEPAFERIAIVNRGEPAMRLINAVRDINLEYGTRVATIALYTDTDRRSMFVREADERYRLGPSVYTDETGQRKVGYLDYARLEEALVQTGADAAWVGWGFVAEHADFADMCQRLGITFIGPNGDTMRKLGDKITSKRIAEQAGVPVVPWSGGPVETVEEAEVVAERIGYPFMIKATAGGGGRGIRRVRSRDEIADKLASARSEAASAFGDATVFIERAVMKARHIEVQMIADGHGAVWPVGVRDCTVQRRNQKIIEEAPSPALTPEQHRAVMEAAADLGRAAGYRNAGTVEFLFEPHTGDFWFMEVNARLQVEHPITELTTGADMVKLQIDVASGHPLPGDPPTTVGHAIEIRLNAEDPGTGFAPAPGELTVLRFPFGPGVRVDSGVEEGDAIAPEFDSMIAKIMAYGSDRSEAVARLRRALQETTVVVRDGASNKSFVEWLLSTPEFHSGDFDTGWVDGLVESGPLVGSEVADAALVAAGIAAYDDAMDLELKRFHASANRGRPHIEQDIGHTVGLRYGGNSYELDVAMLDRDTFAVTIDGTTVEATIADTGRLGQRITMGPRSHRLLSLADGGTHYVEIDGLPHRITPDEGGVVRSPAPSVVAAIDVGPGDHVERGDRLAVVEAMKMETQVTAPLTGTVREVLVRTNAQVPTGAALMVIDPDSAAVDIAVDRVGIGSLAEPLEGDHLGCAHHLKRIAAMLAGYDVSPSTVAADLAGATRRCTEDMALEDLDAAEQRILELFVDLISLFRRDPIDDEYEDITRRSSGEYLYSYLRDPGSTVGLPGRFVERLDRTLAHYGAAHDRTDGRDEALYRITKSYDRMDLQIPMILAILDHRLEHPAGDDEAFRDILDRIVSQTRDRYPAVHDLAREVAYGRFDHPFLEQIKERAYADAQENLDILGTSDDAEEREAAIRSLVDCPQPLTSYLSRRFAGADTALKQALLEVMVRRYYRIRTLEAVRCDDIDGYAVAAAEYDHEGHRVAVGAVQVQWDQLAAAATALGRLSDSLDTDDLVADIYVWQDEPGGSPGAMSDTIRSTLDATLGSTALRRVVVTVSSRDSGMGIGGVLNFTFRPSGDGTYLEETVQRDLHPMMAKRLRMDRFSAFELGRLPTLEDIYVFHAVARDNPRDERLFALAEVRDLTPIRDADGSIVRLPDFERMFRDVLGVIRRFQAHRPAHKRLIFNRAVLYVWPVLELGQDEIRALADRLARETEGIGLQQVEVIVRVRTPGTSKIIPSTLEFSNPGGEEIGVRLKRTRTDPIATLTPLEQTVARLRQRGLYHPADIIELLTRGGGRTTANRGAFSEYDLLHGELVPVHRPLGENTCNIVTGVVTNDAPTHPEGIRRVIILGDPTNGLGNLAEAECARIVAAIELAEREGLPVEWFAVSAGARISMESGTENMDWIGLVLRRLIEFTQRGGEVNVVVTGINVGAQPYWNAEATMLMHTRGILIMTPDSAMVLTGKQALDYSGGVSAEDNQGIGGYERIMGPNGQAQYFARDIGDACQILLRHYAYTYVSPGDMFPRKAETADPSDRDITASPHGGDFATVGDVFSETENPGRKKPFEMRQVMASVIDGDHAHLERWFGMQHGEVAVVWDARIGGYAVSLIGLESKPIPRTGFVPADGPDRWTSGTLFPVASKKVARAINAASGSRPLVVLANLSGFDGSPESMRNLQLEYGAEIGRAVVNFDGPIVFTVVSRYHGGAFVVFSNTLNDNMEIAAVRGSHASVIGGAPAAAVVFAREVRTRVDKDPEVVALTAAVADAEGAERTQLRARLAEVRSDVNARKLGEVADEFDEIHDINRALRVGSVHRIIDPHEIRPYVIGAVERGMQRHLAGGVG